MEHGKVGSGECRKKVEIRSNAEEWGSEEYESDMSENEECGGNKEREVTREKLNTGYVKSGEMNKREKERSGEVTSSHVIN